MATLIPTNVYAELTPNPAAIKFVADRPLLAPGLAAEYLNKTQAKDSCELAEKLFDFPFVASVFITSNFVTVNNNGTVSWDLVTFELREFVREYLVHHEQIVTKPPAYTEMPEIKSESEVAAPKAKKSTPVEPSEYDEVISKLLDEYVRPAVEGDGGAIDYKSFKDGVVTVMLRGSCSGCPSSVVTLKNGIENLLKSQLDVVTEVVAEED